MSISSLWSKFTEFFNKEVENFEGFVKPAFTSDNEWEGFKGRVAELHTDAKEELEGVFDAAHIKVILEDLKNDILREYENLKVTVRGG